jgi:LuxR family maltose regulon positive regulatory protein
MRQPIVLHTKFLIPQFPPGHVARPHLVSLLSGYLEQRLIVLTAPAGYGKTTLAAETITALRYPTLWYQLDADDNDPATYLSYLVEGLCRTLPAIGEKLQQLLVHSGPHPADRALVILLNELLEHPAQNWVLVLDDYHVIHNPVVHALTATLFENQPPGMKFIIATRSQPPLPLARWRVRGRLTEIRSQHLRFSAQEVQEWTVRGNLLLAAPLIEKLVERTEGWGAGLQLALTLLMEEPSDPQNLIERLSGSHPYVFNYLIEEIF